MTDRAPRRWTSIELLLEDVDDEPRGYRSVPGGRVELRPSGYGETLAGEWCDGERVAQVGFSPCGAERPVSADREKNAHRGGGVG